MKLTALLTLGAAALTLPPATQAVDMEQHSRSNPLMQPYTTPYEIPPFELISIDDYLPAIKEGISRQKKEIAAIVANPKKPTFENTIEALDKTGDLLERAMLVFSSLDETMSTPEMVKVAEEAYPMTSVWADEMSMNPGLFSRVKYLYDNREKMNLTTAQRRAIEDRYKSFRG